MHDDKKANIMSIMTPPPLETSKVGDSLDIIINIMKNKNKGSVVILDESGRPTGIITERDIVRRLVFAK